MNQWALPHKNNLGSRINLNNAKVRLTNRLARDLEFAPHYRGNGRNIPTARWYEQNARNCQKLLSVVNDRLKIRNTEIKRHFKPHNLRMAIAAKNLYAADPKTRHRYIAAMNRLMTKYGIPKVHRTRGNVVDDPWNVAWQYVEENKLALKQMAHKYGFHWQMQAIKKRQARNANSPRRSPKRAKTR
jgi:hypothetical protein